MAAAFGVALAAVGAWGFVRPEAVTPPSFVTREIVRHDEIAYWELTARYPQIAQPSTLPEQRFNEAVLSWVDRFADHAERTMATHPVWEMGDGPSEARLDYAITHPTRDIVEITFRSRIDYGVDLSVPLVHRLRIDLRSGAARLEPAENAD